MNNLILMTDSYKASHFLQYPPGTQRIYSYLESRGGEFDYTVFFGLQYFLKEYLSQPITQENIHEAFNFFAEHGEPFPFDGWKRILNMHGGYMPVKIRAVPEGSVIPTHNILMDIENTDPEVPWLVSWLESCLMRAMWYPITVATQSRVIKELLKNYLDQSSDDPEGALPFKLHDFGSRGVSSHESAMIGGAAHLVNFMGSDTIEGIWMANHYYDCKMAGFSIPAAEHSTITSWGKEHEVDAYRNMITQFSAPGKLFSVVSDSYDYYKAVDEMWGGTLRQELIDSGGTLVVRPDSGNPAQVVIQTALKLDQHFGSTINSKGYKVLNNVRIIQGDGVNRKSIHHCLDNLVQSGFSIDNIAFGMGGALLQGMTRDTLRFATKCSAVQDAAGVWHDVFKDPVTDPGKKSKAGRLALVSRPSLVMAGGEELPQAPLTITQAELIRNRILRQEPTRDMLVPVFENGQLIQTYTFDSVRENARVD